VSVAIPVPKVVKTLSDTAGKGTAKISASWEILTRQTILPELTLQIIIFRAHPTSPQLKIHSAKAAKQDLL
jgi:hypothetical protein